MRTYNFLNASNETKVHSLLERIATPAISVEEYRNAFQSIGYELGSLLREDLSSIPEAQIMFAFASEDSDWLGRGVLSGTHKEHARISVFWNGRNVVYENKVEKIEVSPIIKSYEEEVDGCRYLIIIKSIINTSCVVQTQLTRMISKFEPEKIFVIAPVMYKDAERSLAEEFPRNISRKFSYLYFALDDERDGSVVKPGVGGMVYSRLGLGDVNSKNSYMPEIVKERMGF